MLDTSKQNCICSAIDATDIVVPKDRRSRYPLDPLQLTHKNSKCCAIQYFSNSYKTFRLWQCAKVILETI